MNNVFLGKISIKAQKIHIFDFHINDLRIHAILGHKKQKIYFLLNSNKLHINFILDGILDDKKGDWHGFFKKINIDTIWGKIYSKKRFLVYYTNHNYDNNSFYQNNIKK